MYEYLKIKYIIYLRTYLSTLRLDMTMGRVGYGYCLPNPLPRLFNISPYPYSIPHGFEFIVSFPYPSGIPNLVPHEKYFFCKKILKN